MSTHGVNLLVFRDGRKAVCGSDLQNRLRLKLNSLPAAFDQDELVGSLLQAGELECALADNGTPGPSVERITDALAAALISRKSLLNLNELLNVLDGIRVPRNISVSTPEGFAFYALHPLAFADAIQHLEILPARVVVVGIRGIGATLSAVTAAASRQCGTLATRFTVRPCGHPYNRRTNFSGEQLSHIKQEMDRGAQFWIVDEGPGMSGSSFLSVAEALLAAGVPRTRITLICSHAPDPDRLCAKNASVRWRQFQCLAVPHESRRPLAAENGIGGGEWRRWLISRQSDWPASWIGFERLKYLSPSISGRLYKFAGFGTYGEELRRREEKVAAHGFGPLPSEESDGYISYSFLNGVPASAIDISDKVLERLSSYCALRSQFLFSNSAQVEALQQMAEHNLQECKFRCSVSLKLERGVVPDGRMQPYEWLITESGQMLKTDSGGHGDDHFFPGATDIAWDLAGAIVEWRMNPAQAESFLEKYYRISGDNAQPRIADYITAYAIFRRAYGVMAASELEDPEEKLRFKKEGMNYLHALTGNTANEPHSVTLC